MFCLTGNSNSVTSKNGNEHGHGTNALNDALIQSNSREHFLRYMTERERHYGFDRLIWIQ